MSYPAQCQRTYVNPEGNILALGLYRSDLTQDLANNFPQWMHLRQNNRSVTQQLMSPISATFDKVEDDIAFNIKSKFISSAPVDEIDVIFRTPILTNINLTDVSASGVRCIAAPSGCSPSGISQIWLTEESTLENFYYNVLPTRVEITSSGDFADNVDGVAWNAAPSGIVDKDQSLFDVWKTKHTLTWCYSDSLFRKQDYETMEDYETYSLNSGCGVPMDITYYKGFIWWIGKDGSNYYFNQTSSKTQIPQAVSLDLITSFDITSAFAGIAEPSGIIVDEEGVFWVCSTNKTLTFEVNPRYDYFTMDKENGFIYFREDYRDSGVFMSNT